VTVTRYRMFEDPSPREKLGEGVWLDSLQPGGRFGPKRDVFDPVMGGLVWSEYFHFGSEDDDFVLTVPDIRLPAHQYWPLHWHGCWIAVVILEGTCLIGDWTMEVGDVLISAADLEYGPLVVGPDGCQMFEVFAKLHLAPGGYAPEYSDHPTLHGGDFNFEPRSPLNMRNEGRSSLPTDGVKGLLKDHLVSGRQWDLGDPDDPDRGRIAYRELAAGDHFAPPVRPDWYGAFVLGGSGELAGRTVRKDDVLVLEPGSSPPRLTAGPGGIALFEVARTARGI